MPIDDEYDAPLVRAYSANSNFYGTAPDGEFNVTICHTEAEFKEASGPYYAEGAVGVVTQEGEVAMRSVQGGLRTPEDVPRVTRHEMNHAFWIKLFDPNGTWAPYWVCEAFANFVGRDSFLLSRLGLQGLAEKGVLGRDDFFYDFSMDIYNNAQGVFDPKVVERRYSLWTAFMMFVTHDNPGDMVGLMRDYTASPSEDYFWSLFEKRFECTFEHAYEDFITIN